MPSYCPPSRCCLTDCQLKTPVCSGCGSPSLSRSSCSYPAPVAAVYLPRNFRVHPLALRQQPQRLCPRPHSQLHAERVNKQSQRRASVDRSKYLCVPEDGARCGRTVGHREVSLASARWQLHSRTDTAATTTVATAAAAGDAAGGCGDDGPTCRSAASRGPISQAVLPPPAPPPTGSRA